MVHKEKIENGSNIIHFIADGGGNFPIIVVMFPRKEELSR